MKSKTIDVCLTADNNYAEHMYTTVVSLIINLNRNIECNVWILDAGLSNNVKTMFLKLEKYNGIHIFFKQVDVSQYKKYPTYCGTYQTYFRMDIPNIFNNIDTILYLDPDIIVNSDLSHLFDIDLSGYAIAATTSINNYYYDYYILKIPDKYGYFNAGVMLMNLKYMRENNVSEKLFTYLSDNLDKIISFDQDALNAVLFDKRFELGWEYNITPLVSYKYYGKKHIKKHPKIIHYGGGFKPWKCHCNHRLDYEYHYYRNLAGLTPLKFKFDLKKWCYSKMEQFVWHGSLFFPRLTKIVAYIRFNLLYKKGV